MRRPEQREDEAFISNVNPEDFRSFNWRTKRMGNVAVDNAGNVLPQYRPMFVSKDEVRRMHNGRKVQAALEREGHW